MLKTIHKAVGVTVAAGVLLTPVMTAAPLFAATESAPSNQAVSAEAWQQLAPGASHTVQIKYDAFEKDGRLASETIVELEMGKVNSVAFDVYTAAQYADFVAGKDVTPIGRGNSKSAQTGNSYHDTKLIWANRTSTSETFYVHVTNERAGSSSYHLDISGNGTTVINEMTHSGMASTAPEAAPESIPEQSVARSAVAESKAAPADAGVANGPDSAIATGSDAGVLAAGETRWYSFKYDYDHSSNSSAKQATVELKMNDKDSVSFEVWTPAQVRVWTQGNEVNEVGAGSVFNDVDTTLIWVGSARATDRYYVLVENLTDSPAGYSVEISGSTVSY